MNLTDLLAALKNWTLTTGIKIIFVVILTLILIKVIKVTSSRTSSVLSKKKADEEAEKRAKTLTSVIQNFLIVLVLIVSAITVIGQLGIEIAPLLATAGIAGIAIGFAGQSLTLRGTCDDWEKMEMILCSGYPARARRCDQSPL